MPPATLTKPPGLEVEVESIIIPDVLPVLPLKDMVLFPYIILPLSVGRDKSVLAVDRALAEQPRDHARRAARLARSTTPARATSTRSAPRPRSCGC